MKQTFETHNSTRTSISLFLTMQGRWLILACQKDVYRFFGWTPLRPHLSGNMGRIRSALASFEGNIIEKWVTYDNDVQTK